MMLKNKLKEYSLRKEFREALEIPEGAELAFELLAQGEYNMNYQFTHPVSGKKLLLRVNTGSQMHLDHQIEYEYQALKHLQRVLYLDGMFLIILVSFMEKRIRWIRLTLTLAS